MPFIGPKGEQGTVIVDPIHDIVNENVPTGLYVKWGNNWKFRINEYDITPHTIKAVVDEKGDGNTVYRKFSQIDFLSQAYKNTLQLPHQARPYVSPQVSIDPKPKKSRWRLW